MYRTRLCRAIAVSAFAFAVSLFQTPMSYSQTSHSLSLAGSEVQEIAERAYIYAYPLVLLEATMSTLPANRLVHVSAFPDANFRLIVRPNADTLYTNAWVDLSGEPMLLHVADSGGRIAQFISQTRYARLQPDHPRSWLATRIILSLAAALPFCFCGLLLLSGSPPAIFGLVLGCIFSFVAAVMGAWILLIEILR